MIKTANLTKKYSNGLLAVDELSLKVDEGDIFGFLGPNGAGKTTTIRILSGIMQATRGEVTIHGYDVAKDPKKIKKLIGVLPESQGFYNWMTTYEYLDYFYNLYQMEPINEKHHIDYLLEKVGLSHRANSLVGHLSRGMKQRLGIAKSLINNPKIIFLDEPTLGLDPSGQRDIYQLIKALNKTLNITVFITSHLLKDIESLCNKVAIIENGRLLVQESIETLQQQYINEEHLMLRTSDNVATERILKETGAIKDITYADNYLLVTLKERENLKASKWKIIESLSINDIEITEISQKKVTMEDIFFNLVSKKDEGGMAK